MVEASSPRANDTPAPPPAAIPPEARLEALELVAERDETASFRLSGRRTLGVAKRRVRITHVKVGHSYDPVPERAQFIYTLIFAGATEYLTRDEALRLLEEAEEPEWLSECCGAPPHEATPDVGSDNPAGICAQCREHTGFEAKAI